MNQSEAFTTNENGAAVYLCDQATLAVSVYAGAGDLAAARVAVLRKALELAGGACNLDRLAVLETEHASLYSEVLELRKLNQGQ